ncbi:MFS transporter, partial [Streptomyces sp. W16]|uniref:MFS transporter n=1 Tax=Streptomyces sp. W16 TaxID=3076631 RepID=UPI00295ADFF6
AETVAFLAIGLPAGVWADRLRRRPLLIAADLVRAALLLTIPAAALLDVLSLPQLYVVALLVGLGTVLFDVTHMSYVPSLVGREHVIPAVSGLEATQSSATAVGPPLGGLLVQWLSAPPVVLANALGYLGSALFLGAIRHHEQRKPRDPGRRILPDIKEGLVLVRDRPALRALAAAGFLIVLGETAWLAVQPVFLVRELGLSSFGYGLVLAVGAVGGLLGAGLAGRLAAAFDTTRLLRGSVVLTAAPMALLPLAHADWRMLLYGTGTFLGYAGMGVYNVTQVGLRQLLCPEELRGRMNATMRFLMWGAMPLGGILGGFVGESLGIRTELWTTVVVMALAAFPVWRVPKRVEAAT